MSRIFGVTSDASAETRLTNGYQLYDWVMRMDRCPAFWGRGISGGNAATREEIEYLHAKKCRVALIFNDLSEADVTVMDGSQDAKRAVEAAKSLGAPVDEGIALFVEFGSDWSMHHNWMMGYAQTVAGSGFVPGFIGNTDSSKNFNFDRQCSHYVCATREVDGYGAVYWATEPKDNCEPMEWTPFYPSAFAADDIGLWSLGTITMNDIVVNTTYAHDSSLLNYMW